MNSDRDWEYSRNDRGWSMEDAGSGVLRIALLFGSAAVALALIAAPLLDDGVRTLVGRQDAGIDTMSTGSIQMQGKSYILRRSVLQMPDAVCTIAANGTMGKDCPPLR